MDEKTVYVPQFLQASGIKPGEYQYVTKPQLAKLMEPTFDLITRVWAFGMLASMGYQREDGIAVKHSRNKFREVLVRPVTPQDIMDELNRVAAACYERFYRRKLTPEERREISVFRQDIRRALATLESYGICDRRTEDGKSVREFDEAAKKRMSGAVNIVFYARPIATSELVPLQVNPVYTECLQESALLKGIFEELRRLGLRFDPKQLSLFEADILPQVESRLESFRKAEEEARKRKAEVKEFVLSLLKSSAEASSTPPAAASSQEGEEPGRVSTTARPGSPASDTFHSAMCSAAKKAGARWVPSKSQSGDVAAVLGSHSEAFASWAGIPDEIRRRKGKTPKILEYIAEDWLTQLEHSELPDHPSAASTRQPQCLTCQDSGFLDQFNWRSLGEAYEHAEAGATLCNCKAGTGHEQELEWRRKKKPVQATCPKCGGDGLVGVTWASIPEAVAAVRQGAAYCDCLEGETTRCLVEPALLRAQGAGR